VRHVAHFSGRVPVIAMALCFLACDPCENTILYEVSAPGSARAAIIFERSCGAITGFSTHVSIVNMPGKLRDAAGNVFTADSDHGLIERMTVTVRWIAADRVVIQYPAQARVFKRESQANGVFVGYEPSP
jgi:hypothetical protein